MSFMRNLNDSGVTFINGNPEGVQFGFGGRKDTLFETYVQIRPGKYDIDVIGAFSYMGGGTGTLMRHVSTVGRFCSIAGGVVSGLVEHPTDFVSTHPAFYGQWKGWPEVNDYHHRNQSQVESAANKKNARDVHNQGKISIGNDVWIGQDVLISRGVSIGDGAVIASRSVVTKNVPPYSIIVGMPGRVLKYRFTDEIISKLLNLNWWAYGTSAFDGVDCTEIEPAIQLIEDNISTGKAKPHLPNSVMLDKENKVKAYPAKDVFLKLYGGRKIRVFTKIGDILIPLNCGDMHELDYYIACETGSLPLDVIIAKKLIRPGDKVLDAGANIGYFSAHAIAFGAEKVFAFEPVPENIDRLSRLDRRIIAYRKALANNSGTASMLLSVRHNQGHTLNFEMESFFPEVYGEDNKTIHVETVKLDDLEEIKHAQFAKVDIEGGEIAFMKGAKNFLSHQNTRHLLVEIYDHNFSVACSGFLEFFKCGYRVSSKEGKIELFPVKRGDEIPPQGTKPPMYLFSKDNVEQILT